MSQSFCPAGIIADRSSLFWTECCQAKAESSEASEELKSLVAKVGHMVWRMWEYNDMSIGGKASNHDDQTSFTRRFCQNIQQQVPQHFEGSTCRMAPTCWYFVLSLHPKHLCNLRASWRQDALRQQELKKQRKGTVIPRWEPVRPLRGGFCIWKHDVDGWPNGGEMEKVFFFVNAWLD